MKIIKINPKSVRESATVLQEAVSILKKGGIIAYPTDTVYAIGADIFNRRGVGRVYKMKQRLKGKPLPVFITGIEQAKNLAIIKNDHENFLREFWPGPVTAIFYRKSKAPDEICGEGGTIGLRVPNYKLSLALVEISQTPLTATSANISGRTPCISVEEIIEQFEKEEIKPDLILDAGKLENPQPSTVVDMTEGLPRIVRVGPVSKEQLFNFLNSNQSNS